MKTELSVVIPVYNATTVLEVLSQRLDAALAKLDIDYEIIFVNDGSPDPDTWSHLQALAQAGSRMFAIDLMRNFGQQAATLCGIEHARGDYILTMDDDLQHRPEDIRLLWEQRDHDIVIAQFPSKKHSISKRIASRAKGWFDRILIGKPKEIQLSSFRLFTRAVAEGMGTINTPYPFIPALLFYVSKDIKGVTVAHDSRAEGRSNYTMGKMFRLFSNLIINNSSILLRATAITGLTFTALSFLFALYLVVQKLYGGIAVAGWASVMIAISFGMGLILFTLGVIGEYLIRIIATAERRPVYLVRTPRRDEHSISRQT